MTLLHFSGWKRQSEDWSNQQLAEFYRVESALIQARIPVEIDRGVTDEGDPWLIFVHVETGDVVVHFAREGGTYIAVVPSLPWMAHGSDLRVLIADFMQSHPVILPANDKKSGKILLHPGALFTAFVATAFYLEGFRVSEAAANEHKALATVKLAPNVDNGMIRAEQDNQADRDYFSKVVLLAAAFIALELGRDHLAELISGFGAVDANGTMDETRPALMSMINDVPGPEDLPEAFGARMHREALAKAETDNTLPEQQERSHGSEHAPKAIAGMQHPELVASASTETFSLAPADGAMPVSDNQKADVGSGMSPSSQVKHLYSENVSQEAANAADSGNFGSIVLSHVMNIAPQSLTASTSSPSMAEYVIGWVGQVMASDIHFNTVSSNVAAPVFEMSSIEQGKIEITNIQSAVFETDMDFNLLNAFLKSDTDIRTVVDHSVIVIFDESDLMSSGSNVEIYTWQMSGSQSVSIIGSADFFDHYNHTLIS